jgi:hypothetical protein
LPPSTLPMPALSAELEAIFPACRALPVGRAASGLTAVLRCWRQRHGVCRVALPGAVCQEVVLSVLAAGGEPIFCDVDLNSGLVTDSEWARARSLGADVAIVVHLYGNPASVPRVRSLFPAQECLIVDDAAQALGSISEGAYCGSMGDVGLLSFGLSKHISLGNAALLFRDQLQQEQVADLLTKCPLAPEEIRESLIAGFRTRFDFARSRLCVDGERGASAFGGLLEGMEAMLHVPLLPEIEADLVQALKGYPAASEARIAKANLWLKSLLGSGFEPVGMGAGCVPWRYTCRRPGITWAQQRRFAEAMRANGIHVSNWYLPAHWLLGGSAGTLPGVETLAREVFQFWVDGLVTDESISQQAAAISHMSNADLCGVPGSAKSGREQRA